MQLRRFAVGKNGSTAGRKKQPAGERGGAGGVGGRGAAGRDAAPHEASDAAFRARGRRRGGARATGPPVEPGSCAGGSRAGSGAGGGAALRGLRPDVAGRARAATARRAGESGDDAGLADGSGAVAAQAQAVEAPEPAASARGAGRAGAVGQLGPSVDRGPGAGRPGAGGAARRRDVPDAARALRRARHGRGEPACDHRVPERHGRPLAVYADHAGHFGQRTRDGGRTKSVIAHGLKKLGVERPAPRAAPPAPSRPRPKPPKPGPNHPWRKQIRAGVERAVARQERRLAQLAAAHTVGDPGGPASSRALR